jgi:hypothetical protein
LPRNRRKIIYVPFLPDTFKMGKYLAFIAH